MKQSQTFRKPWKVTIKNFPHPEPLRVNFQPVSFPPRIFWRVFPTKKRDIFLCNHNTTNKIRKFTVIPYYHLTSHPVEGLPVTLRNILRATESGSESCTGSSYHLLGLLQSGTWFDFYHLDILKFTGQLLCSTSLN